MSACVALSVYIVAFISTIARINHICIVRVLSFSSLVMSVLYINNIDMYYSAILNEFNDRQQFFFWSDKHMLIKFTAMSFSYHEILTFVLVENKRYEKDSNFDKVFLFIVEVEFQQFHLSKKLYHKSYGVCVTTIITWGNQYSPFIIEPLGDLWISTNAISLFTVITTIITILITGRITIVVPFQNDAHAVLKKSKDIML